jgi:hypothetical protein
MINFSNVGEKWLVFTSDTNCSNDREQWLVFTSHTSTNRSATFFRYGLISILHCTYFLSLITESCYFSPLHCHVNVHMLLFLLGALKLIWTDANQCSAHSLEQAYSAWLHCVANQYYEWSFSGVVVPLSYLCLNTQDFCGLNYGMYVNWNCSWNMNKIEI